jgi:hypothetical protein
MKSNMMLPYFSRTREFNICVCENRNAETQEFKYTCAKGYINKIKFNKDSCGGNKIKVMTSKGGEEESEWLGLSRRDAAQEWTDIPKRLKKIRIRWGNSGGCWVCKAEFIGRDETKMSNDMNQNWGDWVETELKNGECLMGFEILSFTDADGYGYKNFKSLKFIIGPQR